MFTGVVHRIDKGTSGLLVMAKDATAQAGLQEQFARRSVRRRYLAIVLGFPERETGRIDAPIGRDPKDRLRMGIVSGAGGRQVSVHRSLLFILKYPITTELHYRIAGDQ